jgi:hypothetical protein
MGSSYWPRPELSSPNTQRYYSLHQTPFTPIQSTHAISTIAEEQGQVYELEAPSNVGQSTTSVLREARSSYNTQSTAVPDLSASLDKERDSNWPTGMPIGYRPPSQPYLERYRLALGTCLPISYAITQLFMLVYFLDLYLTIPRKSSSQLPRISPQYSIWPYISCTGSLNLTAFKIFAFITAFFFCATFVFELSISLHARPAYWLRRLLIPASVLWASLSIYPTFASKDTTSHQHLYVVSIKLFASLAIKTMSYFAARQTRKANSALANDRASCVSHRWKQLILLCAFPVAILANNGIYACMDATVIQTPGTACYILVAIAAVADWTYAVIDVVFVLNLAYDIYHHDHFEAVRRMDVKSVSDITQLLSVGEV